MKVIKNGKKYDTETAKKIAEWSNNYNYRDFQWCEETLYRKRTGEYFLHGEGGPMSKYAESCGNNSWSGGSRIIPLTYEAAIKWAENHMDADDYENEFGTVTEDDSKTTITISITVSNAEIIRREASKAGISISAYIEKLIANAI